MKTIKRNVSRFDEWTNSWFYDEVTDIKYLQSEVERLEKELKSFKNGSVCYPSEPVKYTEGITDTLEKQITHITNQIRELEG